MSHSENILLNFLKESFAETDAINNEKIFLGGENWESIGDMVDQHKIGSLFFLKYRHLLPSKVHTPFAQKHFKNLYKNSLLLEELKVLNKLFSAQGIEFTLLKGFVFSQVIYENPMVRHQNDLDILISPQSLDTSQAILEKLGYYCYYKSPTFEKKRLPNGHRVMHYKFHECEYRKQIEDTYIKVELHVFLGCIPEEYTHYFEMTAQPIVIDNAISVKAFDQLHNFIHLVANAYDNYETINGAYVNTYIRDLYDLKTLWPKLTASELEELPLYLEKYAMTDIFVTISNLLFEVDGTNMLSAIPCVSSCQGRQMLPWQLSVYERLFDIEKRRLAASAAYIEQCFRPENINSNNALDVDVWKTLVQNEYGIKIRLKFSLKDSHLNVSFSFEENNSFLHKNNMRIKLMLLQSSRNAYEKGGNPYFSFYLTHKDSFLLQDENGNTYRENCIPNDSLPSCKYSSFSIPISQVYVYQGKYLGFNIMVEDPIFEDCYRLCGGEYENYDPEGNIGVLRLF